MSRQENLSRRMTLLFLVALALVAGQALRIPPLQPLPFSRAWPTGTQILPAAVPPGEAPIPADLAESRLDLLRERSVDWAAGTASEVLPCEIFLRVSRHHWARFRASRSRLAEMLGGEPASSFPAVVRVSPHALLEDRDGDGDPLDAGELRVAGTGAEAELFCAAGPDGRGE